jgi:O-succinylbenzoic acid--CoA ligase
MISYVHDHLFINQRRITFGNIVSSIGEPQSDFESETFTFIKQWVEGVEAFRFQTSGSTGTPKEIILTRNQLQQSAKRTINALGLTSNETALVCLDTKYIAGKIMLVRALEANMKMVIVEPTSNPLKKNPTTASCTFTSLVPIQLQEMLQGAETRRRLNQFHSIIIGGARLAPALLPEIKKLSCSAFASYGMTETASHIALQPLNGEIAVDHFLVLPNISIDTDDRGCLVITAGEFDTPIVTNDLVEIITPKSFIWKGRFDSVINSGGYKILPEKVEQVIGEVFAKLSWRNQFFVIGLPDERLGNKLVLVIEGNPDVPTMLEQLQQKLHAYETPKHVYYIPKFIQTETGKIDRVKTLELIALN